MGFEEATEDTDGGGDRSRRSHYRIAKQLEHWADCELERRLSALEISEVRMSEFKTLHGTRHLSPFCFGQTEVVSASGYQVPRESS